MWQLWHLEKLLAEHSQRQQQGLMKWWRSRAIKASTATTPDIEALRLAVFEAEQLAAQLSNRSNEEQEE